MTKLSRHLVVALITIVIGFGLFTTAHPVFAQGGSSVAQIEEEESRSSPGIRGSGARGAREAASGAPEARFIPLAAIPGFTTNPEGRTLAEYINILFRIAIGLGALIAVIKITLAGIKYMSSSDAFSSKEDAKKDIQNSLLGLLLILSTVVILSTIYPNILNLNILQDLPGIVSPDPTQRVFENELVVSPRGSVEEILEYREACEEQNGTVVSSGPRANNYAKYVVNSLLDFSETELRLHVRCVAPPTLGDRRVLPPVPEVAQIAELYKQQCEDIGGEFGWQKTDLVVNEVWCDPLAPKQEVYDPSKTILENIEAAQLLCEIGRTPVLKSGTGSFTCVFDGDESLKPASSVPEATDFSDIPLDDETRRHYGGFASELSDFDPERVLGVYSITQEAVANSPDGEAGMLQKASSACSELSVGTAIAYQANTSGLADGVPTYRYYCIAP